MRSYFKGGPFVNRAFMRQHQLISFVKKNSGQTKATTVKKHFDISPEYPPPPLPPSFSHLSRIFIGGERDVASHAQYLPGQTFTNLQTHIHTVDQRDKTLSSSQKNAPIQSVWPEKNFFYAFPFIPNQVSYEQILDLLRTENWPPVSISC